MANNTIDSHLFSRSLYTFVGSVSRRQGTETGEDEWKGKVEKGGEGKKRERRERVRERQRKMEKKVESVVRRAQRVIS